MDYNNIGRLDGIHASHRMADRLANRMDRKEMRHV